jgi:hypothetical protein
VNFFFESEKSECVKMRKVLRAKIKKVHEVLYKYSHEKMEYFLSIPELANIFVFYEEQATEEKSDESYFGALEIILLKCQTTLME